MFLQTIQEQFFSEAILVFYVIIIALSLETSIFFIVQKLMRYQQSPTWMLQVSTTMGAMGLAYIYRILADFVFAGNGAMTGVLNKFFVLFLAITSIPSGFFLRSFLKRKGTVSIMTGVLSSVACSAIAILFLTELITGTTLFEGSMYLVLVPSAFLCGLPLFMLLKLKGKESGSHTWIFLAIVIGLISSLALAVVTPLLPGITTNVITPVILVGTIASLAIVTGGFFYLPPINDLLWPGDLVALLVINQSGNQALFKKSFSEASITFIKGDGSDEALRGDRESVLMSGLGGIMNIVNELKFSSKKLELIDQGVLKILLMPEDNLIFALITKNYVPILKSHLTTFKDNFMLFYKDKIDTWAATPEKFSPAGKIADSIFVMKQ